ncbi:MAG: pyruvate, phosphate dikinase [Candidatus Edwardsbacteria bacterium RIFOXYD12_FULL_50_11]|uniref:Pyruvate, phosphate dikinase n=1 Tax=Candidatus Edwardsbacteria bacterium GWF2_54_11 TaxID=1817851 RepID=A0A1F5RHQ6_9BACT|nr:MAG: pyruvate, phosphate dikinase [Candidatus Edwardsbacteria bacterium RifOxyC12_full_54_24]OGF07112.1 MAG: pyruvate, phosphate dikinase [Candidatus Edwardsbacteria bacterium RifOxyA12_full_54_48]OGF10923.1 MAG: pyruvate, phosphate dikinase [Candidatus Edwardsbacteria bacterium GWE2_54_12]OGF13561.1 MAG: pyruvate, phosphate dikinase [Candidatus Edwardsbacteria bacterium GWF2_54_11]OGF15868.1 MAG: pyruvate, phosphate dikinase [Candidatus Edwardsbacteria bacterium RIFOXYD12_FULL_50_11]OGJ174
MSKYVYFFGGKSAEGSASDKNLLGGKGANLAEMCHLGIPVPAGFTISTEMCTVFYKNNKKYPPELKKQVETALAKVEKVMGMKFGDKQNPLLVSVRSGARSSMPGMMETVLNVGLCSATIPGMIKKTNNPRFVYDAYRRLIMMYSDVVMEKAAGMEPKEGQGIRKQLDDMLGVVKKNKGYKTDADLTENDLIDLCGRFKAKVKEVIGQEFPDNAMDQLWGGIGAVFSSWNGKRAISYRRIEGIPDEWGTAVNVQAMVFGNMGESSATGVAFSRNPANGDNHFYGEWLVNAQGEDVVAGIRTPNPLNEDTKNEQNRHMSSLQTAMPEVYKELNGFRNRLEKHYRDMQDIEFTIQEGRLWMLQCRIGKRTGTAALNMAMDMVEEKLITKADAVTRVSPAQLDELLHPIVDPAAEKNSAVLAKGLPAGPGGANGQIVFTASDAVAWQKQGQKVILVREETNPEDVEGMRAAVGILTARGGMTSHAALVARGWGKCCIVGSSSLHIDAHAKTMKVGDKVFKEGDHITLNGTRGYVYAGQLAMIDATENPRFMGFMKYVDSYRQMKVRTNADTPEDAAKARGFGAEGIGLFRTEHMFYGKNSEAPLFCLRKMIISQSVEERRAALAELYPFVKKDIKATLEVMDGFPVTIRLLDPPLHEFVPTRQEERNKLAQALGITPEALDNRADDLHESNPMMGHRGVRLGVTYPEITEMQVRAILESTVELIKEGKKISPEIMVPVVGMKNELVDQKAIVDKIYAEVCAKYGVKKIDYMYGTMIEVPRAALTANRIAETAEFFSYGTNDLTQMGFGFSRDDIGGFVPAYVEKKILPADPFQILDQEGIGQLLEIGIQRGRATRPNLKVGICGEHGGEPSSVEFCHRVGMNYVSCSPFRVPIARLAAAQAAIKDMKAEKSKIGNRKPKTVKPKATPRRSSVPTTKKAVKKAVKKKGTPRRGSVSALKKGKK